MALAVLAEYRHRKETLRESSLRMELAARAQDVAAFTEAIQPYLSRLTLVSQHIGPEALQCAVTAQRLVDRLARQWAPEGDAA